MGSTGPYQAHGIITTKAKLGLRDVYMPPEAQDWN